MCRRPQCCLCQSLLILPAEACAPPWNVIRLDMSELSPSIFPDCHSFHLQGPRNVVLSLSNLTVSNPYSTNRLVSPLILKHRSQLWFLLGTDLAHHLLRKVWTCCQLWLRSSPPRQAPTLHHRSCLSVGLLLHWRCHTVALALTDVGTLPSPGTLNRQRSSLRGNLSQRVQTSVCFVPKDSFVAKRRTALVSHPNNQRMDPLRLGDLHCKVSETSFSQHVYVL